MLPLIFEDLGINRITLPDLPERAQLMRRVDRKFSIGGEHLELLFTLIAPHYSLVQAGDQDASVYLNRYWDGVDRPFFHAHRVKKPRRYKFRQRTYAANGMSFWELKERQATGYTRKMRLEAGPSPSDEDAQVALHRLWNRAGVDPPGGLQPALDIHYKRLSFVNNNGHERLTLDYDLCLSEPINGQGGYAHRTSRPCSPTKRPTETEQEWLCSRDLYILELKQDRPGPSILDPLRRGGCLKAMSFSKYYIGSLLWQAHQTNHQTVRAIPTRLGYGRAWTMTPIRKPF
jgi:hypothetical protein